MPVEVKRCFEEAFECIVLEGYGLSETSPVASFNHPDRERKPGSIGTPISGVEMKVVDAHGHALPCGEVGEIVIRGHNVMKGYLNRPDANKETLRNGWFHSGDIGHFDADGILWFTDRRKDVIKTGGENVASIEVEKAIYAADENIAEAVVIGLPHERWTEAITAIVVAAPGTRVDEAELLRRVKERLAGFKVPKAIVAVDELPRTSTGKIQKNVLRDRYARYYDQ